MNKAKDFIRICFVVAVIAAIAILFVNRVADQPTVHSPVRPSTSTTVPDYSDYQLPTK